MYNRRERSSTLSHVHRLGEREVERERVRWREGVGEWPNAGVAYKSCHWIAVLILRNSQAAVVKSLRALLIRQVGQRPVRFDIKLIILSIIQMILTSPSHSLLMVNALHPLQPKK